MRGTRAKELRRQLGNPALGARVYAYRNGTARATGARADYRRAKKAYREAQR